MAKNEAQITEWNGPLGERWAKLQADFDRVTRPYGDAAIAAAAPKPGEKIIDIGCGAGDSTLTIADMVGPKGDVLGVDVSKPMLEVARHRGAGLDQVSFAEADASVTLLPGGRDLLFSRFGVMFFDDPVAAFSHLHKTLKPEGRLTFVCWQLAKENPWAVLPVQAVRAALKLEAPPADPHSPGPFAFGDAQRVTGILEKAGFRSVAAKPFEHTFHLGHDLRSAAEGAARTGPLGRLVRELGEARLPEILEAVAPALKPYQGSDGAVAPPGRTWVFTACAS